MHPVIKLPDKYWVFDFTKGPDTTFSSPYPYSIGRYDEIRPDMYTHELFEGERDLHVGIDIGTPVNEPVFAFQDGEIFDIGLNDEPGSYGTTVITQHQWEGKTLLALHGHLSMESLQLFEPGQKIESGDCIGYVGSKEVNGGWEPHLHFQLSWIKPENCDLPGVVRRDERTDSLAMYPDPRMVLGQIY